MDDATKDGIGAALGRIPSGLFIVTACHEDRATGMLASWVQQVCFEPPMITLSIAKGRPIMPLISESRQFALCQLPQDDRLLLRKFASGIEVGDNPFLGLETIDTPSGLPILAGSLSYLECELSCHMDVEGDHDLFVGKVFAGAKLGVTDPYVHTRENGFSY